MCGYWRWIFFMRMMEYDGERDGGYFSMNTIMMDNDILMIMVTMVEIYWFWMVMDILNDMFYCGEKSSYTIFWRIFFLFWKKVKKCVFVNVGFLLLGVFDAWLSIALRFRFGKGLMMMMRVMVFRCLSNRTRLFSIANRLDDCQSDQHNHEYCIIIIISSAAIPILESDPHVSSFCNSPSY